MTNESSSIMERLKEQTPLFWLRIIMVLWFVGYYIATQNTENGLVALYPMVGNTLAIVMPNAFIVAIIWLLVARDTYPSISVRTAGLPQYIYTAFSFGWFLSAFPELSFVAVSQHLGTALAILLLVWAEDYYGTRTD